MNHFVKKKSLIKPRKLESSKSLRSVGTENDRLLKQVNPKTFKARFSSAETHPIKSKQVACLVSLGLGQFCLFIQIQQEVWSSHFRRCIVNHIKGPYEGRLRSQPVSTSRAAQRPRAPGPLLEGMQGRPPPGCPTSLWSWSRLSPREPENQRR